MDIPQSNAEFISLIKNIFKKPIDLRFESPVANITIAFLTTFSSKENLQTNFLAPLKQLAAINPRLGWDAVLAAIPEQGYTERESSAEIIKDILNGRAVVKLEGNQRCYSFDTYQPVKHPPGAPLIERTIRGCKISFVEETGRNISLIRERIRNSALRVEGLNVGTRTETCLAVLYLEDVANPQIVAEVFQRLNRIDIDGIVDSGYIEQLISDNHWSFFPLTQSTERPDKAVAAILEGRVVIFVDGSAIGIIVPTTVNELYQSPEDYFFPFWFGVFLRVFRILGNNIAVTLPGLYIALAGVNPELLPINIAFTIAGSRIGVAIPLVVELLLMEFVIEIFREGSLRLPTPVSQTLGVASGIVLGFVAVNAGLVSNSTLVVALFTAIASYSGPNYEIGLSWRILRFGLIFTAAVFGLFGLTIGGLIILGHAAIQNSFGVSYLSPWAPLLPGELIDTVFRRPLWMKRRLQIYRPVNDIRMQKRGEK